ncbi:MAG: hypothetical protein JSS72_04555 [Armatimonadetes bacterium]|nr:hypothetical protein [Armatimonadota bacterium]
MPVFTPFFIALALLNPQDLEIRANVKTGDVLKGEQTIRAIVQSKDIINQVEFYLAGELRDSKSSTPYEFKLDTIGEEDGEVAIKLIAYSSSGEKKEQIIRVMIDNGVSKGAPFHTEIAQKAFEDGNYDLAIQEGRIALHAQKGYVPAKAILARAYSEKGVLDRALKYAEDAQASDPDNDVYNELVMTLNLKRVFTTYDRADTSSDDNLKIIGDSLKSAIQLRAKVLERKIDALGTATEANEIQRVDLLLLANRYSAALAALRPKNNLEGTAPWLDRYAYTLLRMGRYTECRNLMFDLNKSNHHTMFTAAVDAALRAYLLDYSGLYGANNNVLPSTKDNLGFRSVAVYALLRQGNTNGLRQAISDLQESVTTDSVVSTILSVASNKVGDFEKGRQLFRQAILQNPMNTDAYLEQAIQAIQITATTELTPEAAKYQLAAARVWLEAALASRPESAEALTCLGMLDMLTGKYDEAIRFVDSATMVSKDYAPAYLMKATVIQAASRPGTNRSGKSIFMDSGEQAQVEVRSLLEKTRELDPRFALATLPTAKQAFDYFMQKRTPLIASPFSH